VRSPWRRRGETPPGAADEHRGRETERATPDATGPAPQHRALAPAGTAVPATRPAEPSAPGAQAARSEPQPARPGPSMDVPATGDRPGSAGPPPIQPGLPRLAFVGAGRVGTTLATALRGAGWPVTAVASRDPGRRERFLAHVPGAHAYAEPHDILDESDLLFLTVPDDAIAALAAGIRLYSGQAIVHTSGVLPAAVLAPAMAAGTEAGSFHPLVAFTDLDTALAALPGSTVAIEGDEGLVPLLREMAGALGARPVRVTAEGKAAHHAAAVLAAGGLVALLDVIAELGAAAGLDDDERLEAYLGLARQGLENARRLGTGEALTGPVVRGDVGTVRIHLAALRRAAPDALPVYLALSRRALALAAARGDLEGTRADELRALLASAG
jgi:predicted short-subunit dehydrogenase-like oxidoreductase (DUF2520 family)